MQLASLDSLEAAAERSVDAVERVVAAELEADRKGLALANDKGLVGIAVVDSVVAGSGSGVD